MRRHFTEDKFIALFLVNAKKNKERQSGSGEVKRIAGTTTQTCPRSADSWRRSRWKLHHCAYKPPTVVVPNSSENETHRLRRQALPRLDESAYNWFTIGRSVSMDLRNAMKKLWSCKLNSELTTFTGTSEKQSYTNYSGAIETLKIHSMTGQWAHKE